MKIPAQKENKPLILWIPYNIYSDPSLSASSKLILGEIFNLMKVGDKECWASNGHFSEMFGMTRSNISFHIQQLEKQGWIKSKPIKDKHKGWVRKIYPLPPLSNILDTLSSRTIDPIKYSDIPYQVAVPDKSNIESNIENKRDFLKKNPIFNDPDYQKRENLDRKTDSGYRLYVSLSETLNLRYPVWKYGPAWEELKMI